jgi:hypothetical protein
MKSRFLPYIVATATAVSFMAMWLPVRAAAQAAPARVADADKKSDAPSAATPRTADGHPDLTGLWTAGAGLGGAGGIGGPKKDANGNISVLLPARGGSGANFEIDNAIRRRSDPNKPVYKPEYVQKIKELDDNEATEDPAFYCRPPGVPRIGPPSQIVQTPGQLVFLYQTGNTFRVIPTDGRPHHTNLDDTYMGDSVGHWEGDALVVDVIGFTDDTWLDIAGYFHTAALHVTEKLTREGNILHYQAIADDPNVLVKPWEMTPRTLRLSSVPQAALWEDPPCNEHDAEHLVTKEHH